MLHLLESAGHPRRGSAGWTAMSTIAHTSLIAAAAILGASDAVRRVAAPEPEPIIYAAPAPTVTAPAAPMPGTTNPVPGPAIVTIPDVRLPRYDAPLPDLPSSPAHDVFGSPLTGPPATSRASTPGSGEPGVYLEHGVDRAVVPLAGNRQPDYPAILRSAGVQGEVLVRFVVDTNGRVETPSVRIISATHALFGDAVKRWLSRNRYAPAEVAGEKVRQMVEQRVGFALIPD